MDTADNERDPIDFIDMIPKKWGSETIFADTERYCGKILTYKPLRQSSLHYHNEKDETFYCHKGELSLEIGPDAKSLTTHRFVPGDCVRIPPKTLHRLSNVYSKEAVVIEASTRHSDDDVVRIEPSRKIYD